MAEGRMQSIDHPSLGLLVRDKFGDFVTLRKFPFLADFLGYRSDRSDEEDAALARDWKHNLEIIAPQVRRFGLRGELHRQAVFEVYVESGELESPSAAQVAGFEAFIANEERICNNAIDAILRFYRSMVTRFPRFFDLAIDEIVFPRDAKLQDMKPLLEFDCLTLPRTSVGIVCPLRFSWSPAWDEEHGLTALVYDGQVLSVGTDEVESMQSEPSDECFTPIWNKTVMTPEEIAAYDAYCSLFDAVQ